MDSGLSLESAVNDENSRGTLLCMQAEAAAMAVLAAERLTAVLDFNAERSGPTAGLKASPCSSFSLLALLSRTAARDGCHDGAICALSSKVIRFLAAARAGNLRRPTEPAAG